MNSKEQRKSEDPPIAEIALMADVAISTALRVLSGRSNVSSAITARVLNAHQHLSGGSSQQYAISSSRRKEIVAPTRAAPKQSDVARLANVGSATVSRALSGHGLVGKEKRERILKAAQQLNYIPDRAAQILRGNAAGLIGIIVPSLESSFVHYVEDIERIARLRGAVLTLSLSHKDESNILRSAKDLAMRKADGLIIIQAAFRGGALLDQLRQFTVPIIWVGESKMVHLNPSHDPEVPHLSGDTATLPSLNYMPEILDAPGESTSALSAAAFLEKVLAAQNLPRA